MACRPFQAGRAPMGRRGCGRYVAMEGQAGTADHDGTVAGRSFRDLPVGSPSRALPNR